MRTVGRSTRTRADLMVQREPLLPGFWLEPDPERSVAGQPLLLTAGTLRRGHHALVAICPSRQAEPIQSAQCLAVVRLRRFRRLVVFASTKGLIELSPALP